jgi:hypothetical protein
LRSLLRSLASVGSGGVAELEAVEFLASEKRAMRTSAFRFGTANTEHSTPLRAQETSVFAHRRERRHSSVHSVMPPSFRRGLLIPVLSLHLDAQGCHVIGQIGIRRIRHGDRILGDHRACGRGHFLPSIALSMSYSEPDNLPRSRVWRTCACAQSQARIHGWPATVSPQLPGHVGVRDCRAGGTRASK